MEVAIVGGGIGGLTLALALARHRIRCRVYEAAPEIKAVGVGINILPHASRILSDLGLADELARVAVITKESAFFNRFGQLIYREPAGRNAGYAFPQYSIHRGDLHLVLLAAAKRAIGHDRIFTGYRCTGVDQDEDAAIARFVDATTGASLPPQRADAVIACDGLHSAIRKQLYPDEGPPLYSGVNMWRGVTKWQPFLTGASMVRAGWHTPGKMVIYPIRNHVDAAGNQLVNWVAEIETPSHQERDWNRRGRLEDFLGAFEDWHFDWLDVPELIRGAETVLEFPMVDQEPLVRWTFGRITLLGDAAHPMVPRGSNGAGQAIIDARTLADLLAQSSDPERALERYEALRLPATSNVVLMNRTNPPDAIVREVVERTGDRPFENIDDVISPQELQEFLDAYKRVAGYDRETLGAAHRT